MHRVHRALLAGPVEGAAQGLAVHRDHARDGAAQGLRPGDETLLEGGSIQRAEDQAELVMARRAVRKRQEAAQKSELLPAEQCDAYPAIGPAQHRAEGQKQHFVEWIEHLERLARIGQLGKMAGREVEGLADRVTDKCAMCPSGTNSCTEGGKSQP